MITEDPIGEVDLCAYVDDQLDPARRIEVERWLSRNPEAAARIMADLSLRDALRFGLAGCATPTTRVVDAARALDRRLRWVGVRRLLPRMGMAAAVALGLALGGDEISEMFSTSAHAAPLFIDEAVMSHRVSLVRAQMRSQPESPAIDAREIRDSVQLALPQLPAGWRVLDAQVFPSDDGPSVQVAVDPGDGTAMSLFAVRARGSVPEKPAVVRRGAQAVAYWREGDTAYALTGNGSARKIDLAAEDLADNPAL